MKNRLYKILLIEDSLGDAFVIQKKISQEVGFSQIIWTHSTTLQKGIQILKDNIFDIIFADLSLPDGSSALDNIKNIQRNARGSVIVILTGFFDPEIEREVLKIGIQYYLIKGSFKISKVLQTIFNTFKESEKEFFLGEKTRHILVLNDQPYFHETIRKIIENTRKDIQEVRNYHVLSSYFEDNAMELIKFHHPILILIDIDLSNLVLNKLILKIKKIDENIKIALLSTEIEKIKKNQDIKYDILFSKPFKLKEFTDYITQVLEYDGNPR